MILSVALEDSVVLCVEVSREGDVSLVAVSSCIVVVTSGETVEVVVFPDTVVLSSTAKVDVGCCEEVREDDTSMLEDEGVEKLVDVVLSSFVVTIGFVESVVELS